MKFTICDNSSINFNALKNNLLAFNINYYFHFTGKSLCEWGPLLLERVKLEDVESDIRKLQSITCLSLFSAGMENLKSKHEREPLLIKKLEDSCSGDPKVHWASAQTASNMPKSRNGSE